MLPFQAVFLQGKGDALNRSLVKDFVWLPRLISRLTGRHLTPRLDAVLQNEAVFNINTQVNYNLVRQTMPEGKKKQAFYLQ